MVLYLLRHGIAGPPGSGQPDALRVLTPEGMARMKKQVVAYKRAGWQIDQLLSSPYYRAQQTAGIVSAALGAKVREEKLLVPSCTVDDLAEVIGHYPESKSFFIVSHQPALGEIVYALTGSSVSMQMGTLAVVQCLAVRPRNGILLGLYAPEVMHRLGEQG